MRRRGWSERAPRGLESLEGRKLPSLLVHPAGGGTVSAEVLPSGAALALQGSARGALHRVQGSPDVGASAGFAASGHLDGIGSVRVTGTLWGTGNIVGGQASGTLVVSGHRGTLTLRVQGPATTSFTAAGSGSYGYTVVGGTGAYAQTSGQGTIAATLGSRSIGLAFGPSKA